MEELQKELTKVKRQGIKEVVTAIKVILIIGDKSCLTKAEKHNLEIIEKASNTLLNQLDKPFVKE